MSDCIFCKIANGDIPSNKVYEDDRILAFHDLEPQAPVHVLIIPKVHIQSTDHVNEKDAEILGYIMTKIKEVAKLAGIENGYRTVINTGENGQQTVAHIHFHILGNRSLQWPPG